MSRLGNTGRLPATQTCNAILRGSRKGGRCTHESGWGTDHLGFGRCKLHGGTRKEANIAAAREEAMAQAVVMGLPLDIGPSEALLQCVRIAAGEVAYATDRVAQLRENEAIKRSTGGIDSIHPWIRVRQDAVDRLARYSKMALDAGVAERQVQVAERLGGLMGELLRSVLSDLHLTAQQQRDAPEVVRRHLLLLERNPTINQ